VSPDKQSRQRCASGGRSRKARTSFRHNEKREARRFSGTAQKPFFSLLLTTLQALAGACGQSWKSRLIMPLTAGYPSGDSLRLGGPRTRAGLAGPAGADALRPRDGQRRGSDSGVGLDRSQPEPRGPGPPARLPPPCPWRESGPHVLVDQSRAAPGYLCLRAHDTARPAPTDGSSATTQVEPPSRRRDRALTGAHSTPARSRVRAIAALSFCAETAPRTRATTRPRGEITNVAGSAPTPYVRAVRPEPS
jgi:hypothetical protein